MYLRSRQQFLEELFNIRTSGLRGYEYARPCIMLACMLLWLIVANTKWRKKPEIKTETQAHWYSSRSTQRELSNKYQYEMGLDGFQKSLHHCALDESSLSIVRVCSGVRTLCRAYSSDPSSSLSPTTDISWTSHLSYGPSMCNLSLNGTQSAINCTV